MAGSDDALRWMLVRRDQVLSRHAGVCRAVHAGRWRSEGGGLGRPARGLVAGGLTFELANMGCPSLPLNDPNFAKCDMSKETITFLVLGTMAFAPFASPKGGGLQLAATF